MINHDDSNQEPALMDEKLTTMQAYKAMLIFLEDFCRRGGGKPDEIGFLLDIMQLLDDNKPGDIALWDDWVIAVKRVLEAK